MKKNLLILFIFFSGLFLPAGSWSQDAGVNRKKIEREHRKNAAKARKEYEKGVKDHKRMQTKETQRRMKQTKKQSKKNTPLK